MSMEDIRMEIMARQARGRGLRLTDVFNETAASAYTRASEGPRVDINPGSWKQFLEVRHGKVREPLTKESTDRGSISGERYKFIISDDLDFTKNF